MEKSVDCLFLQQDNLAEAMAENPGFVQVKNSIISLITIVVELLNFFHNLQSNKLQKLKTFKNNGQSVLKNTVLSAKMFF